MASIRKPALLLAAMAIVASCTACSILQPLLPTVATPASTPGATAAAPGATITPGGAEVALGLITWPAGPVVARVNGVDITLETFRAEVTQQIQAITTQYQVDWSDAANAEYLPGMLDDVLERLISLELLRQLAAREKVEITDAEVQQEIESIKEQALSGGQYADFPAFLAANALTEAQFQAMVRDQVMIDKMIAAHGGPKEVEQIHARHILVADEAKAQEVLAKLQAGETFEDLAKLYGTDGTKDQGGDLGWFPRGTMVAEFEEAAFALQPGETSGVVKTTFGYHIIRVDERAVRALEEPLLTQVQQQAFTTWLEEQMAAAQIERLYSPLPTETPAQ